MTHRGVLRAVGTGALAVALTVGLGASPAAADYVRDKQWDLKAFDAESVWRHSTGKGVTVAVIDSGVDARHPDLAGNVLKGRDFTGSGSATEDSDGHGTQVAGVVAAHGHGAGGGSGMKGLAPEAKILPVKVDETAVSNGDAIRYAVDQGVDVLNLSYSTVETPDEREAVTYAVTKDVVVVGEAGDGGIEEENFPASYPGVVSAGAIDKDGELETLSSYGDTVLTAPAEDLVSPDRTAESGYSWFTGTSAAAAQVSGAAALVRAEHPDLSAGQVINRLVKTAKPPVYEDGKKAGKEAELPDKEFGYGVVRPFRAVTYDIPAGPEAGPLEQPKPEPSASAGPAASGGSTDDDGMDWLFLFGPPIVTLGIYFLILLVVVALLIVVLVGRSRNKRRATLGQGPGGPQPYPGPQGAWPGQPAPGQPGFGPGQFGGAAPQQGGPYGAPVPPPPAPGQDVPPPPPGPPGGPQQA
ncbi:S8 family serine peptidase [Streptomyces sp. HNM0574]|uniref:S8 family serine peptidase n=1 Tax=Streptomyces sp. HNM0574 TaxID=2714954 RepID=UPI00146E97CB|nr:S8 family serine peptidase [Streptomyces sp. HNM0574]NLU69681.1 S8 family serine peptidase [Streptomyces sp. HNM0574]